MAENRGNLTSYRPDIKVMDCTLRDGGLVNNFEFTDEFVKDLYEANVAAGVDYMEFGYKADKDIFDEKEFGKWKFCKEEDIRAIVGENDTPLKISVMADVGRTNIKRDIPPKSESVVDMVRVATYINTIPAAIEMANYCSDMGYQVTIFEGKDKIGGVLRYGIPEFRLPKTVLDDIEYRHLALKGIKIRPNTTIGGAIGIDDLFRDGYKSIFIGTGVWKPNSLHIKGETFGNVHFGINYLNNPDSYHLGETVIVIGAGNAAMDVARTAKRKGSRNVICFSITKEVAASKYEFSYAQLEGITFEYNKRPVEIKDDGVIFRDIIENEDGTFTDVEGTDTLHHSDSVIISISQGPQNRIVNTTTGLKATARGLLDADETGHTSRPGIFASGDVVNGARTVVEAVAHSKIVAESMHQYMQSLPKDSE